MAGKPVLDASSLTMEDLRRAKVALGGKNPWELLDDPIEAVVITIYCIRSREDPAYTMEMAAAEPLGSFAMPEEDDEPEPDPPTGSPEPNGEPSVRPPASNAATPSAPRRRSRTSTPASVPAAGKS